ncbi:response regulator [Parasedimentitalea marina]|uniref:histidine kinase n=1 Tax=Parasedimentitalea marina TaxID=2483033 RepID=A0A3T0N3S6_9RHOB|nr:response regulator [Parasedimentitalea marina]
MTWSALQRVDARLQELHQETLSQVAQALDLSKRSADLATSAPYLLNQRSNFLIEQEGAKLLTVLERVRSDWPQTRFDESGAEGETVMAILDSMATGVTDLVAASSLLDGLQAEIRGQIATLGRLRNTVSKAIAASGDDDATRLIWWSLQSMNADALNAAYARNLIGVGEEQRHYLGQRRALSEIQMTGDKGAFLESLEASVWGSAGVFELRRRELSSKLDAQNAVFRIRHDANRINELASNYAVQAEAYLAQERDASSTTIRLTRISVTAISALSLMLALSAAIYVSRYVTFNISRVSAAMVRLANGDRASALPRRLGGKDEIGDLFRSFRSFRANALRLDRSNRQLDQRNALFEKVFINISDGIAITDATGRMTASNPMFAKFLHVSDELGELETFVDWLQSSRFAASARQNDLKPDHRGFCELTSIEGQILEIRASKLPDDGRVWLLADVTERRKMSDRLQQIDRIEALGKVAGDTAHDFANILSSIRTHAHLLKTQEGVEALGSLDAIGNAVDFGSSLTDRLLAFARKQSLTPERVDLNALIEGMTDLVEISLKPNVALVISLPPEPLHVRVDPGQLESALFNLLLNANNAIKDAGRIEVSLDLGDEGQARIRIWDDGQGMSEHVLTRAIEPFFTTRGDDGGTGLGLSIVYGFIHQTGGAMTIESSIGQGTEIEVLLPLEEVFEGKAPIAPLKTSLLVEDDPKIRTAGKDLLESLGFEVKTSATGPEALKSLSSNRFDLLLSDLDLGSDVDGLAVIEAARRTSLSVKTIIMSGKSTGERAVPKHSEFIEKPLTRDKLLAAIRCKTGN